MTEVNKKDAPADPNNPTDKPRKDEPKQQQPKPQPHFEKPSIDFLGDKGKYLLSIWAFDQYGKPMGNVPIKIFYGKETQPRYRLMSNANDSIELMIEFLTEKLKVVVTVGHKKEEKELNGPEQQKKAEEMPKELKGHGIKATFKGFFFGGGKKK